MIAENLVETLNLLPHPEGGFYREEYRSPISITTSSGDRSLATSIYYLLRAGEASAWHRIRSDELWFFHCGGPLTVNVMTPNEGQQRIILGPDISLGHRLSVVVPAGLWFGATPSAGTSFSLVSCVVAPGFDFADFELASAGDSLPAIIP